MKKKTDKRFVIVSEQTISLAKGVVILQDRETGVNYLFYQNGYAGGLTPLLDSSGKPIVSSVYSIFDE